MAFRFKPCSSQTAKKATGSKWTGSCAKLRAQTRATLSRSRSRLRQRTRSPTVPADLRKALGAAAPKARTLWSDITPNARRDWIHWITSAKQEETRARRIKNACSMLAAGKRRVCCFDRSGFYAKA